MVALNPRHRLLLLLLLLQRGAEGNLGFTRKDRVNVKPGFQRLQRLLGGFA
jgi:hypothetical protein